MEFSQHFLFKVLVDTERSAVRRALNEERSRYCAFVSCIKPMLDEEACMVSEFQQLEEVSRYSADRMSCSEKLVVVLKYSSCIIRLGRFCKHATIHYFKVISLHIDKSKKEKAAQTKNFQIKSKLYLGSVFLSCEN